VVDPYLSDVEGFGWQALQPHQDAVIKACEGLVADMAGRAKARRGGGAAAAGRAAAARR
jgi:hypothetical protein